MESGQDVNSNQCNDNEEANTFCDDDHNVPHIVFELPLDMHHRILHRLKGSKREREEGEES